MPLGLQGNLLYRQLHWGAEFNERKVNIPLYIAQRQKF